MIASALGLAAAAGCRPDSIVSLHYHAPQTQPPAAGASVPTSQPAEASTPAEPSIKDLIRERL
jgi:hypothetical protein